jgi:hypothetical protein
VQDARTAITADARALARKFGAIDVVAAPVQRSATDLHTTIEGLWFDACAQAVPQRAALRPKLGDADTFGVALAAAFLKREATSFTAQEVQEVAQGQSMAQSLVEPSLAALVKSGNVLADAAGRYRFFCYANTAGVGDGSRKLHNTGKNATQDSAQHNTQNTGTHSAISSFDPADIAAAMRLPAADGLSLIQDRSFRFKAYPKCFVGSEAVDWMVAQYGVSRPQAVRLGEKMFEAGLFHHVADEHNFKDEYYFYRFMQDEAGQPKAGGPSSVIPIDALPMQEIARAMHGEVKGELGLEIKDRRHLLKVYPQCFVGSEAVDWLVARHQLSRPQAVKLGERMFDAGIFHHVLDEHSFKDIGYFYRFYQDEPA